MVDCTLLLESLIAEEPNTHHFLGCAGDVMGEVIGERLHDGPCADDLIFGVSNLTGKRGENINLYT